MSRRREIFKQRPVKRVVWLVVEGETEQYYFSGFHEARRETSIASSSADSVRVRIKCARGISPINVVKHALDLIAAQQHDLDGQKFYCVFDVEDNTPQNRKILADAIDLAANNKIGVVLSNPCFEVWLHCHLENFKPRSFATTSICVQELRNAWTKSNISLTSYAKADPEIFSKLKSRLGAAIDAAKNLREVHHRTISRTEDANASTDVYRLIEYLLGKGKTKDYQPYRGKS